MHITKHTSPKTGTASASPPYAFSFSPFSLIVAKNRSIAGVCIGTLPDPHARGALRAKNRAPAPRMSAISAAKVSQKPGAVSVVYVGSPKASISSLT